VQPDPAVVVPVVYADDDVVVVDKPAGLVVHPGAGHAAGTMVNGLLAAFPDLADVGDPARPGIVHRLDKDTSGLLVVARTPASYRTLTSALAKHAVEREYLALVWGRPDPPAGLVDAPIGRSGREPTRMAVSVRGRDARTGYATERSWEEPAVALLRCRLETGRTHQIRVHLAAIGHAVVGDRQYRGVRPELRPPRIFLHATRLAFRHPADDRTVAFESPLPSDLEAVLDALDTPG
jgi:23S rRNA pseudouridine1911/1915/1917 synthase